MSFVRRLIALAYFVEVGLLLLIVPWTGFLEHNYFVERYPWIRALLGNGFVKGTISGFGIINLAAGLAEFVGLFTDRRDSGDVLPEEWRDGSAD